MIVGTAGSFTVDSNPRRAAAVQALFPLVIGTALVSYGWLVRDEVTEPFRRRVYKWTGLGLVAFFVVGFWFGQVSRLFQTSFQLAVFTSLATGAAFGSVVGVFAARLQRTNEQLTNRTRELRRKTRELEAKTERLDEFASFVSHDLRSPLSVARGRVQMARETRSFDHLDDAAKALDRTEKLIDRLLTLAREASIGDIEPVDLSALAAEVWTQLDDPEATIDAGTDATVHADRELLRQLLANLFENAVQHGDATVVTVGDLADGFHVADDGPGIPEAKRERAFEAGVSGGGSSGYGLRIVRQIADAHGWTVTLTESADGGARFEITEVRHE